ncbi:hypothetical protein TNCT_532011 [Trichonephila clavata]|uniref:Uncharacterized protein n=1 Tax=Trichonephila clavata TaxID=2740835 RepID=A0A8X6G5I1_TRICU|nr:hypothetical protein TNCT_532011 [Trichonephila clavata]
MANPGRIKCSSKVHKTPVLPTRHQHIPRVVVKRKVGKGDSSFLDEKPHQSQPRAIKRTFFSAFSLSPSSCTSFPRLFLMIAGSTVFACIWRT